MAPSVQRLGLEILPTRGRMTVLILFALLSFPRRRKSTNLHRTTWRFRFMDPPRSRRMTV